MKMSLEFEIIVMDNNGKEVDLELDLELFVRKAFNQWSDGRYLFSSEMVRVGLNEIAQRAVEQAVQSSMYEKYGNSMVRTSNTSRTAIAVIETEKVVRDLNVHVSFPE